MKNERELRHELAVSAAKEMMRAARTAPKAKGMDLIEIGLCDTKEELELLASTMEILYESNGFKFFLRDAGNIREAEAVVLIGTREQTLGLNCAYCGAPTCAEKSADAPCAFNSIDVGIAVGSACATAARLHVDTRVMYSAGSAAQRLGWPAADCRNVIAIPVAAASKNPFFDRKPKENKA